MRVPDEVRKCVVFIGRTVTVVDKDGQPSTQDFLEGTGFLVAVPSERVPDVLLTYVVTAAHVAERVEGDFWVRENTTRGRGRRQMSGAQWYRHPEGRSVDVAVLPFRINEDTDQKAIHIDMMILDEERRTQLDVGVGDEVFLVGLFPSAYGRQRNTPIVRKGNLAMIPEDKIKTGDLGFIDAFLIEVHSLGGISGSPVFVRETVALEVQKPPRGNSPSRSGSLHGAGSHYLLGLVHGHWEIDEADFNALYFRAPTPQERSANLGIALVIPASKIIETINQPALIAIRTSGEDKLLAERASEAMKADGTAPTPQQSTEGTT